jgi:outer membrane protein OmpA-like peptidoglycan-associated protein
LTIEGELTLLGRPPQPVFAVSKPPTELDSGEPLDAPPEASPPRRVLQLEFDPDVFPDLNAGLQLVLPKRVESSARFLEINVALEVSGATEAAAERNDVLDVPLSAVSPPVVPAFMLRVLDDVGAPIAALELTFAFEGQETQLTTNEEGLARIHGQPAELALARFPDAKSLKGQLKPLWDTVRPIKPKAEAVERIALGGDIEDRVLELDQPLTVSLFPRVERARLLHFFFDTNKTFLLPDSDGGQALKTLQQLYARNTPSELLIVGHADAAGGAAYNDKLSLERAETVLDYLRDNVDGWLKWYGSDVEAKKRWGTAEDLLLIAALPDAGTRDATESPVSWFQRTRGLKVDGKAGPVTRRALVNEYMSLDGATLPPEITPTTHGCGENFPEVPTPDGTALADNRRVELFFFDSDLGVQPPPDGKNSAPDATDYPEWVRRAHLVEELTTELRSLVIKILDGLNQALPDAPYELTIGAETRKGKTDDRGFLHERDVPVPNRCTLKWGYPPPPGGEADATTDDLIFERQMFLDYAETDDSDPDEASRRRLNNLGYTDPDLDKNVAEFQTDFGLPNAAWFDQKTFDELRRVHDDL